MRVAAIIQARMGSTRLPGKVLKKVMGKTLLEYQIERIQRSALVDLIIVATTEREHDNAIVKLCEELGVNVYCGSEYDVLSRYYKVAVQIKADVIVRLTSDCPLIDPEIMDGVIQLYFDSMGADYASNALSRTFPRGLDTEVFSFQSLEEAYLSAKLPSEREHVTSYIHSQPKRFKLVNFSNDIDLSCHRWTVDTQEDYALIQLILQSLYPVKPDFTMQDVLDLLDEHPTWIKLNAHIEQKKL